MSLFNVHTVRTATALAALSATPRRRASWNMRFSVFVTSWWKIASTYSNRNVLLRYMMCQNSTHMLCFGLADLLALLCGWLVSEEACPVTLTRGRA